MPIIEADRSRLRLLPQVAVDVHTTAALAHDQLCGVDQVVSPVLLSGEVLPGWYDDWVLVERERMRQLYLRAMEQMADSMLRADRVDMAIETALMVVSADPLRETAHRILVDAYVCTGNHAEALRQYDRCCALLRDDLALLPSETLTTAAARAHGTSAATSTIQAPLVHTASGVPKPEPGSVPNGQIAERLPEAPVAATLSYHRLGDVDGRAWPRASGAVGG